MQLVKNAYAKDNRLDVQIQKSEILYLDPNKNKTNEWLQGLGLQLPSDTTAYGSIGSITYPNGFVKMEGVKYEELIGTGNVDSIKHSRSDYDSTGAVLSDEQKEYFADSKIRDEQGRLMVMYHGTPSGNFENFRSGTYFTPNREYADVYQNPGASSISYGKKQDAPTTFAMYLNMENPFDTRNTKERNIFMKEYYNLEAIPSTMCSLMLSKRIPVTLFTL